MKQRMRTIAKCGLLVTVVTSLNTGVETFSTRPSTSWKHSTTLVQPYTVRSVTSSNLASAASEETKEEKQKGEKNDLSELVKAQAINNITSSGKTDYAAKRREFELALGKAADTLRKDYPHILHECPNFEIFDQDVELVDPSGVKLHGITAYRRTFGILRAVMKFFYTSAEVSHRMMLDSTTKGAIRMTWHATLTPKLIYGGPNREVHLDGISVYELNRETGLIDQHRLERACMNNQPIRYPQGIWKALNTELVEPHGIPVCYKQEAGEDANDVGEEGVGMALPSMRSKSPLNYPVISSIIHSNSFMTSRILQLAPRGEKSRMRLQMSSSSSSASPTDNESNEMNQELDLRNQSRIKFGMKPLTEEEFETLQKQVRVLEVEQQEKLAQSVAQKEAMKEEQGKPGLLQSFLAAVNPDACETNDDCERPKLCCDYIFKKSCCASGQLVGHENLHQELAYVPVPQSTEDFPQNF